VNAPPGRVLATALFILAFCAGRVAADPIYFGYESQVYRGQAGSGDGLSFAGGAGRATLSGQSGNGVLAGPGVITVASIATAWTPDLFSPYNFGTLSFSQPLSLKLTLTDDASRVSGALLFAGNISGMVAGNQAGGTLSFTPAAQSILLGHYRYDVDLTQPPSWQPAGYGMLGWDTWYWGVDVTAQVDVQPAGVSAAPEPTSLGLAGLGLAAGLIGAGWHGWRRRT